MSSTRNTFKLGITVMVMFGLFVGALMFIGGGGLFQPPGIPLVIRFRPGGTLPEISEGSFVNYFGQRVGVVRSVKIIQDVDPDDETIKDQQFLEVRAVLYEDRGLRRDCEIVASGPPLGGVGTLEILQRGNSPDLVGPDGTVYGQSAGFQAVLDMLTRQLDETNPRGLMAMIKMQLDADDEQSLIAGIQRSLEDINHITASLAGELDRERSDVLLTKIHGSLDHVHRALGELADMIEENRPKISNALTAIDSAAEGIDQRVVAVLARELELQEDQETTVLTKIHGALSALNDSLADIKVVSHEARGVLVLNSDRVSELVENASAASLHLKQGIQDLSLHPWKLLVEPSVGEKRELHIFNTARAFAEAAVHLDDATSRLKSLLDAGEGKIAADDPELAAIREDLMSTIGKFSAAEQALWGELKIK